MSERSKITDQIQRAMKDPDRWAVRIVYRDDLGRRSRRVVSPSRWSAGGRFSFMALCLCRQESRWFRSVNVESAELVHAADVLMPEEIEELPPWK